MEKEVPKKEMKIGIEISKFERIVWKLLSHPDTKQEIELERLLGITPPDLLIAREGVELLRKFETDKQEKSRKLEEEDIAEEKDAIDDEQEMGENQ